MNDEQRRASGVVLFCIVEIRVNYIMKIETPGRLPFLPVFEEFGGITC